MEDKVTKTLNAVTKIEQVKVSPFFKDKTMQKLFAEKANAQESVKLTWFSPKFQLATLVVVISVNIWAFSKITLESVYQNNVNEFAETFGFSDSNVAGTILNN
ncbi:hypothetical protein PW52_14405 [Tamlana sedimentorum]|uniref:Uncharacterized protein n=1 Tax=Neotamlana sedimentorum TaxID=1435349 RepID=A0A0D7W2A1_9FLAO|nr:hypothetical protein [Tamlana sedimentorum]KJD33235.1 hypothetical protein PW52_14405 [Tamlana sedimentorum]